MQYLELGKKAYLRALKYYLYMFKINFYTVCGVWNAASVAALYGCIASFGQFRWSVELLSFAHDLKTQNMLCYEK